MKTGRLLKFHRPDADVHAYLYQDANEVRAALYVMRRGGERQPVHAIAGTDEERVVAEVRAWVEAHYPRPS